ncbi:MAG TPA: hypothetical protein VIY08_04315 [Candidatus Nitrosocosmicus sp.]
MIQRFPRLFTKFATNSHGGRTGLGLYLSKCIIENIMVRYGLKTIGMVKD